MITHGGTLEQIKNLGYSPSDDGACCGLSRMWVQAFLSRDLMTFYRRLELMSMPDIEQRMKEIADKVKTKRVLTDDEKIISEIGAYYDGLVILQKPYEFRRIFGDLVVQSEVTKISQFTASKIMEEKGGIEIVRSNPKVHFTGELQTYFESLANIIKKHATRVPVTISSGTHQVSMHYNPSENFWVLFDSNNLPYIKNVKPLDLTKELVHSFTFDKDISTNSMMRLSVTLSYLKSEVSAEEVKKMTQNLEDLQTKEFITDQEVKRVISELKKVGTLDLSKDNQK